MTNDRNMIACDTCKWSGGRHCNSIHTDCLRNFKVGPVVAYYSKFLPKNQPDYDYAWWEPGWLKPNQLSDDLFEI